MELVGLWGKYIVAKFHDIVLFGTSSNSGLFLVKGFEVLFSLKNYVNTIKERVRIFFHFSSAFFNFLTFKEINIKNIKQVDF